MRTLTRLFLLLLVGLLLTAGLAELGIYILKLGVRREAESLLAEIKRWRLGETTWSQTQEFRVRYMARRTSNSGVTGTPPEESYAIQVSSAALNSLAFHYPTVWRLGVRPSGALVEFSYRDQKLSSVRYTFYSATSASSVKPTQLVAAVTEIDESPATEQPTFHIGYGERPSPFEPKGQEHGLGAVITTRVKPAERDAAFDFDLSCLSSVRGCQLLCKMMPSVWREAVSRAATDELFLPKEELENPKCSETPH